MDEMSLSRRERAFCRAYVKLWNGREAALAAGYKPRLAGLRAEKILLKPAAQQEVCRLCAAAVLGDSGEQADGEEILRFLTAVMRGEVRDGKGVDGGEGALPKVSERTRAAELLGRNQRLFGTSGGGSAGEYAVRIIGEDELL